MGGEVVRRGYSHFAKNERQWILILKEEMEILGFTGANVIHRAQCLSAFDPGEAPLSGLLGGGLHIINMMYRVSELR